MAKKTESEIREELESLVASEEYPIVSFPEPEKGHEHKNRGGMKGVHPVLKKLEARRATMSERG